VIPTVTNQEMIPKIRKNLFVRTYLTPILGSISPRLNFGFNEILRDNTTPAVFPGQYVGIMIPTCDSFFDPLKRYHVIPANFLDYDMMYFLNKKHDYLEGQGTSLFGTRSSNKVQK
jgi:hypothetical protein